MNRHCASGLAAVADRGGLDHGRHGQAVIAGGVQSLSTVPERRRSGSPGTRRLGRLDVPLAPDTPEAPAFDMSITVGWNTAEDRRASPARRWTPGPSAPTSVPSPPSTRAASRRRSCPSRSPPATARPSCSRSTSTRARDVDGEAGRAQALHPEIEGFSDHRRQRLGHQRRRLRPRAHLGRVCRVARADAPGHRALLGLGRRRSLRDRAWHRPSPSPRRSAGPG